MSTGLDRRRPDAAPERAVARVRAAWEELVEEAPELARRRDVEAMRVFAARKDRRDRSWAMARSLTFAAAFVGAIVIVLGLWRPSSDPTTARLAASVPRLAAHAGVIAARAAADHVSAPPVVAAAGHTPDRTPPRGRVVVTRACDGCRTNRALLTRGAAVVAGERVDVPSGARLSLALERLDRASDAVEVDGPAELVLDAEGEVRLDRGRASVSAIGGQRRFRTAHATLLGSSARWTMDVSRRATRVTVEAGHVEATSVGGAHWSLAPGDTRVIAEPSADTRAPRPTTAHVATEASAAPSSSPDGAPSADPSHAHAGRWAAVRSALATGSRARAESEARALVAVTSSEDPLHGRAMFVLAELELARGAAAEARPRLVALARSPDPRLAEDAAFLLARACRGQPDAPECTRSNRDSKP